MPPRFQLRLASLHPPENPGHLSTTFVLDDTVAVDAGAIASRLSVSAQQSIRHVLLTHSHLDHVQELPQFLDVVQTSRETEAPRALDIHAEACTLADLDRHMFGGLWPDVVDASVGFATLRPFELNPTAEIDLGVVTALPHRTVHRVPAVGYVFRKDDGRGGVASIAIFADTGYREGLLGALATESDLRLLAMEVSYPNRLDSWANAHGHLTPRLLKRCLEPLEACGRRAKLLIHHLKPAFAQEVLDDLARGSLDAWRPEVVRDGQMIEI